MVLFKHHRTGDVRHPSSAGLGRTVSLVLAVVSGLVAPSSARAQCVSDMDCKGNRVCLEGVCQYPIEPAQPRSGALAPPCRGRGCASRCEPPCGRGLVCLDSGECAYAGEVDLRPTTRAGLRVSTGWAVGGGAIGIVTMGVLAGLVGTVLALFGSNATTYIGIVATVVAAVGIPLAEGGAASARRSGEVRGLVGARITGWVLYGLTLVSAVVAIALGLAGGTVGAPVIIAMGALGITSALMMTLDAFASAREARNLSSPQASGGPRHGPFVVVAPSPSGRTGVTGFAVLGGWRLAF
jgi:hypothetical protein